MTRRRKISRRPRRRVSKKRSELGLEVKAEKMPEEAREALEEVRQKLDKCPRCGRGGWIESKPIGGQIYLYYVHPIKVEGEGAARRRVEKCYLGPLEYKAAQIANPLGLSGFLDSNRFFRYALVAIEKLDLRELQELRDRIDERIRQLGGGCGPHVPKEG
jgi:hypothetical protein